MSTKLAKKEQGGALAVGNSAINEMFESDGGYQLPIDAPLPSYKIVRETAQFMTPTEDTCKEIVGHILYWHNANQYWGTAFSPEDSNPPDCCSSDGVFPDGGEAMLEGPCAACPHNQYGSAVNKDGSKGKGKACQNTVRLYVLAEGEMIPVLLKAPPSSLGKKESLLRFLTNLPNVTAKAGVGTVYQLVKVRFTLYKKQFDNGEASLLRPEVVKVLNPNDEDDMPEIQRLAKLSKEFRKVFNQSRIAEDVAKERGDVIDAEAQTASDDIPI